MRKRNNYVIAMSEFCEYGTDRLRAATSGQGVVVAAQQSWCAHLKWIDCLGEWV